MNYTAAYETALARFRQVSLEEIARFSGYPVQENIIQIRFLGQEFTVEYPTAKFDPDPEPEGELPVFAKILVLHYLTNARAVTETGKLISYKELPGGGIYIQPFTNRAIRPLIQAFGDDPSRLLKAAGSLGGEPVPMGDAAVRIKVFPKVPVTLVIWAGDEEFPASGNILFDSSAPEVLHTEDYAVLAGFVVQTLKK